ncbi:MAG: glycosyltransferase family 4 protein [Proteobacteria bacterium]|nr:glycosyltransferase family 4 protein [Pseudomonadota bacterium]
MNILLINYEYPPTGGGAANETFFIAQHLANKNIHRPVVLTSRYKNLYGKTIQNGVVIYRVNAIRKRKERSNLFEMISYIFSACFSLPRILSLEKIDACIVFFSIPCGPIGLLAHYIKRIPYIVFLQGGDVPGNEASIRFLQSIVTPLRRLVMRKAIAVTANSVGLKKLSETHDPTLVHYISNGVDTSLFCPSLTVKDTTSRFLFLFVGRFQAQKNLIFLIEQIAKLRAQNQKEKFTLKLVGDGPDRKSIEYRIR